MRKRFLQKALLLLAFPIICSSFLSAVHWSDGAILFSGTYNNTDVDFSIDGDILVADTITVKADTQDVTISNTTKKTSFMPAGHTSPTMVFETSDEFRTIEIICDYDLIWKTDILVNKDHMLVVFKGPGKTVFKLSDSPTDCDWRGAQVTFTGEQSGDITSEIFSVGTKVYIFMDQTYDQAVTQGLNKVVFQRKSYLGKELPEGSDIRPYQGYPTGVVIGPASHITYLSTNDTGDMTGEEGETGYGTLAFDPTHEGVGRMYLKVNGTIYNPFPEQEGEEVIQPHYPDFADGGLIISGHFIPRFDDFDTISIRNNIYLNAPAGPPRGAIFRVIDELAYKYNTCAPEGTCPPEFADYSYDPNDDQFKGLLILNSNGTVPKMANDPYQEYNLWDQTPKDPNHPNYDIYWAQDISWAKVRQNSLMQPVPSLHFNVQPGVILGFNGKAEVYHKTFLEHVTLRKQTLDFFALQDFSDYVTEKYNTWVTGANVFKKRNPSAFHIDGLNEYSNLTFEYSIDEGTFTKEAYDTENNPSNAVVCFYGNSRALFLAGTWGESCDGDCDKNCHVYEQEPILGDITRNGGDIVTPGYGPWAMDICGKTAWVYTFTIDEGPYNKQYIPSDKYTPLEGENVIDIEGPLECRSFGRGDAPGRGTGGTSSCGDNNYVPASTQEKGEINLPTVSIDHTGRETEDVFTDPRTYIQRPLVENQVYQVYNSPSIFLNDNWELYDTLYNHNDITKPLDVNPNNAIPNWVGGERKFFGETVFPENATDPNLDGHYAYPKVSPFDSEIDFHEHFVGSGFRWAVTEQILDINKEEVYNGDANNCSIFRFYDHGDYLDTLDHAYGRLFMCTCGNNLWSDGSSNEVGENCFINIYRANRVDYPELPADTINLSLRSVDEPAIVRVPMIQTSETQRAHHLFLMQRGLKGKSYMELGWTFTVGDSFYHPWERKLSELSNQFTINTTELDEVTPTQTPPATLSIDGNYFYFGGTDWIGNKAIMPVSSEMMGSTIYVNHGGRITITQPGDETCDGEGSPRCDKDHGYDSFFDLPVAYRLWCYEGLRGTIDLPKDQVTYGYGFGRQPYDIDNNIEDECGPVAVHVDTYNRKVNGSVANSIRISKDQHSGEEVVIPWRWRKYDTLGGSGFENSIVKSIPKKENDELLTRFTGIVDQPVTLPDNVLYFGAGDGWADIVTQLRITGATLADPLHLLIDGYDKGHGYARIYEITSQASNPAIHGEGQHAVLFLNNSGRVGLGSRSWNEHSVNAWNQLGKDFVTIVPMGNGTIDLNSDVYVADGVAFVAGDTFAESESQRLTINLNGNDLYIPANGVLDLSSFGKNNYRQEIEFAGEGRVLVGPGATIRFPNIPQGILDPSDPEDYPTLYFNDNTQLVFLGDFEMGKGRFKTLAEADADKVKIFGCGQIWLNKNGRMEVNGNAAVRVGSDEETPFTYLRVSIQQEGDWVIGTEQESGGSFEVGNITQIYDCETEDDGAVNFELVLNGEKSRFHMDRAGFLGLFGVGIIDKSPELMNGDSTLENNPSISQEGIAEFCPSENAWHLGRLYDVHKVIIDIKKGIFDVSNAFAGNDRKATLTAIGELKSYNMEPGSCEIYIRDRDGSRLRGGSPVVKYGSPTLMKDCGEAPINTFYVNAWDYADIEPREDGTMYGIWASAFVNIFNRTQAEFPGSTIAVPSSDLKGGGISIVTGQGGSEDFFKFITYPNYSLLSSKYVNISVTAHESTISYVNTSEEERNYSPALQIFREPGEGVIGEGNPSDGAELGVLGARGLNEPEGFTVIRRKAK